MGFFILPDASEKYWNFRYTYLKKNVETRQTSDIFRQVNPKEYMYVSSFNVLSKTGFDFIYEKFNGNKLEYKLYANRVKYNEKTKDYTLYNYVKRTIGKNGDILDKKEHLTLNPAFTFALPGAPALFRIRPLKFPSCIMLYHFTIN